MKKIIVATTFSNWMRHETTDIEKEIKESFPRASTRFSCHVVNGFWRNHSPSGVIVAYEIRLPSMPAAAILELARHAECLGLQLCCRVHCRIEWILPTKNHAYKAVQDWIFDGGDPKTPRDFDRFRMLKNYVEVRTLVAR